MASPRTSVRGMKLSVGERRHPEGYCGPTQIEFDPGNMGGTGAVGKGLGENTLSAQFTRGGRHGSSERREPSLRGRAAGHARRAPRLPHQRDSDLAEPEGALALSQQRPGRILRPPGPDPDLAARPQGGSAPRARRDLLGRAEAPSPRRQRRRGLGDLPRAAGDRGIRLRSADVAAMKVSILDDYHDTLRTLNAFSKLAGHEDTIWNDHVPDTHPLAGRLKGAEALVLIRERTKIRAPLLERLPRLMLISQRTIFPHIDVDACTRLGIVLSSNLHFGMPSYATAELTWGLIIAALRDIPKQMASLKAGKWQSGVCTTTRGKTLGVFGYGRIGAVGAGDGKAVGSKGLRWGP